MTEEQKLINVQIGKRLQTVRENMGYTQEAFAELFLANCDREERNRFIERMLAYMGQLMLQPK